MDLEVYKQEQANVRNRLTNQTQSDRTQAMRDNNWITSSASTANAATQGLIRDLVSRRTAFYKDTNNEGKPFPLTEADKSVIQYATTRLTPGPGTVNFNQLRPSTFAAPPGAPAPAQAAPAPAAAPTQPPNPVLPSGTTLETYRGDKPPTSDGNQLPADSPWVWGRSKSTGAWSVRPRSAQPGP
jgi:hypothetical protein